MSGREYVRQRITEACAEHDIKSDSLLLYVDQGIPPGSFLTAVLEDRFTESFARADHINAQRLAGWAYVMYWAVPSDARGSAEKVQKWIEAGGLVGLEAAAAGGAP